jgi:hypothetical protein
MTSSSFYSPTSPPYSPPTPASEKKVPFINSTEPILDARFQRLATYPIDPAYADLWNMYKRHVASFWTPEEVDLSQDKDHYARLDSNAQFFLSSTLAFFASSDGLVNENLITNFCEEVQRATARVSRALACCNKTRNSAQLTGGVILCVHHLCHLTRH